MVEVTVSATAPTLAEALAAIGSTSGGTGGTAGGTGGGNVDYFPADRNLATFPSPESSNITVLADGTIVGPPYLRNKRGAFYEFVRGADGKGTVVATGYGDAYAWTLNSMQADPTRGATRMIVLTGEVWLAVPGAGNVVYPDDDLWHAEIEQQLPDPGTPTGGGGSGPAMPADPPHSAVAPGSTGNVVLAGPSQTIKSLADALAAAQPGDTIRLDPAVYAESLRITKPVLIDGQGTVNNPGTETATFSAGAIFDCDGVSLAGGMGGLVPMTDVVIRGCEVRRCGLNEGSAGGTAGIRPGAACWLVVENCYVHDCQDGLYSGGFTVNWTVKNSILVNNGIGVDGRTHNIYISNPGTVTLENVTSILPETRADSSRASGQAYMGHALKTRANALTIVGGYYRAFDSSAIDIPNGTTTPFSITGATFGQAAGAANHTLLGYATEGAENGVAGGMLTNCTLLGLCDSPNILTQGGTITATGCVVQGAVPVQQGSGTVVGL